MLQKVKSTHLHHLYSNTKYNNQTHEVLSQISQQNDIGTQFPCSECIYFIIICSSCSTTDSIVIAILYRYETGSEVLEELQLILSFQHFLFCRLKLLELVQETMLGVTLPFDLSNLFSDIHRDKYQYIMQNNKVLFIYKKIPYTRLIIS